MVNHAHESAGTRPLNRNSASGRGSVSMQAVVWLALVALAVAGRLWQPTWNGEQLWHATPLAAVALAAGFLFANPLVAASVPRNSSPYIESKLARQRNSLDEFVT